MGVGKDGLNFGREWLKTLGGDMMTKADNLRNCKSALVRVAAKAILGQRIKNLSEMRKVLGTTVAENQDVIEVDE